MISNVLVFAATRHGNSHKGLLLFVFDPPYRSIVPIRKRPIHRKVAENPDPAKGRTAADDDTDLSDIVFCGEISRRLDDPPLRVGIVQLYEVTGVIP